MTSCDNIRINSAENVGAFAPAPAGAHAHRAAVSPSAAAVPGFSVDLIMASSRLKTIWAPIHNNFFLIKSYQRRQCIFFLFHESIKPDILRH
jgi:hypothetical protein